MALSGPIYKMCRTHAPNMNRSPSPTPQPAAIAAFLRGVDRRGRLLAQVQTGDSGASQTALTVASKVFAADAGQWPIAQWPMQYWRLLLSVPAMGQRRADGDQAEVLPEIARLAPPQRAAVLLHLVAGLEDGDAAAALGLDVEGYQQRIRSALPHDAAGVLDLAVWRGWRDGAQLALEQLPEASEAPPAPARPSAALQPSAPSPSRPSITDVAAVEVPHRSLRWLWLLLVVLGVMLAASLLLHPRGRAMLDVWRGRIHAEALPPAAPPKARFDPNDASLDPDRAMDADPAGLALAHRLPLLSWLAATGDASALEATTAPAAGSTPTPAQATTRLPPLASSAQRSSDRDAWAKWQGLTENERNTLREVAVRVDAMTDAQRNALRMRYDSQAYDAQLGWHLGPTLGRDWPRVAPLFAFTESDERSAVLALLREATPEEIDTLARLAQTTPPETRAQLRRDLLAQPRDQRAAWLQARLNR